MSLLQFLRILMARRAIILLTTAGCFLVALVVSQLLAPRYEATARIMLDVVKPDPVTGEVIGGRALTSFANTQAQLIKDYQTAGVVVDRLGWTSDPNLVLAYNQSGMTSQMDIRRWLAQTIIDRTKAYLGMGSNILYISYTASNPDTARQISDAVRAAYLEDSLRRRREEATKNAEWFREQTDKALAALMTAEAKRTAFARANNIVLQPGTNSDIETAKLEALSGRGAAASVPTSAPVALTSTATSMQLDAINQEIAQSAGTLGPNHPRYQALLRQRSVLAASAEREAAMARMAANGGAQMAAIEQAYQAQRTRVLGESEKMDKLAQLQRDIDLRREEYNKTAQRLAGYKLEEDVSGIGMTPLGDASGSSTPSFPNVPLILGGALGLGLGLGVLSALFVELLARRVRSEEDLEYAAGAAVFATITDRKPDGAIRTFIKKLLTRRRDAASAALVEA